MNSILTFLGFMAAFAATQAAVTDFSAQASVAVEEMRRRLLRTDNTCLELLGLPMTTMLYASHDSYSRLCGTHPNAAPSPYFDDCLQQFDSSCLARQCDSSSVRPWVYALPTAGQAYVCRMGLKFLTDVQKNGGNECVASVAIDLGAPYSNLYNQVFYGNSLNCKNMSSYMSDFYNVLDSCKSKSLSNLTGHYFNDVIDMTPCKGQLSFGTGAADGIAANAIVVVIAMVTSVMAMLAKGN